MKQKIRNRSRKKNDMHPLKIVLIALALIIVIISLTACAQEPIIREVKVPTPCEVKSLPKSPKDIDIENSSIGVIMEYLKNIVQYAKNIQPIIKECVVEK